MLLRAFLIDQTDFNLAMLLMKQKLKSHQDQRLRLLPSSPHSQNWHWVSSLLQFAYLLISQTKLNVEAHSYLFLLKAFTKLWLLDQYRPNSGCVTCRYLCTINIQVGVQLKQILVLVGGDCRAGAAVVTAIYSLPAVTAEDAALTRARSLQWNFANNIQHQYSITLATYFFIFGTGLKLDWIYNFDLFSIGFRFDKIDWKLIGRPYVYHHTISKVYITYFPKALLSTKIYLPKMLSVT